ncbi:protoporphyrinogen/coproporphyrinogen oxidase [Georgenia sp. H159]|uniref:protoporphyrinogen/coproporphyrinogen oxidase n=1 Tax=Georgenia sp. H159 TaxID=3076115 RepID=UPI002D78EE52|nr:FAD-dependent oxidoreductase [Georgenia sp. H159]
MSDVVDVVVVGGGIGGLTAAWELARAGRRVTLLEASDDLGGLVRPLDIGGVVVNRGPEAFAVRRPALVDLCADLAVPTELPAHGSWLLTPERGAFPSPARAMLGIPADPVAPDVVAAVGEQAASRAAQDAALDPDVGSDAPDLAAFVAARMGTGLLDRLVRPLVSAIHGADPSVLPVDSVMPGLRAALRRTGSLSAAVAATLPEGPAVASVTGGMHRLADALAVAARAAGATLVTRAPAAALERGEHARWRVVAGSAVVEADDVVVATSGATTLALIAPHVDTRAVRPAPGAPTTHVTLLLDAPELDGAPRGSGIIAADGVPGAKALTHVTAKWRWAQRAAGPGRHVVRLSYGRPGDEPPHPGKAEAVGDAARLLGTDLRPDQLRDAVVVRHDGALAPADPDVRDAVLALAEVMGEQGLHLAGALVAGTGLPAIVTRSRSIAAALG